MKRVIHIAAFILIVVSIVLGVAAYWSASAAYRRFDTTNNFKSLCLSIETYVDMHKQLPRPTYYDKKTGEPLYSWRYRIIPYVGSYKRELFYDVPWNHPSNSIWLTVPQPFANGGYKEGVWQAASPQIPNKTNIFAITGPDTGFGDPKSGNPASFDSLPKDLILFAEVADSGKHWMEPGDFDIRTMQKQVNGSKSESISSVHRDGFHVIFADMDFWYLSNRIPFKTLEKFLTISEAAVHDRSELLQPYRLD